MKLFSFHHDLLINVLEKEFKNCFIKHENFQFKNNNNNNQRFGFIINCKFGVDFMFFAFKKQPLNKALCASLPWRQGFFYCLNTDCTVNSPCTFLYFQKKSKQGNCFSNFDPLSIYINITLKKIKLLFLKSAVKTDIKRWFFSLL